MCFVGIEGRATCSSDGGGAGGGGGGGGGGPFPWRRRPPPFGKRNHISSTAVWHKPYKIPRTDPVYHLINLVESSYYLLIVIPAEMSSKLPAHVNGHFQETSQKRTVRLTRSKKDNLDLFLWISRCNTCAGYCWNS